MDRFEIIGLALFCGTVLAAFIAPVVALVVLVSWWVDRSDAKPKAEKEGA